MGFSLGCAKQGAWTRALIRAAGAGVMALALTLPAKADKLLLKKESVYNSIFVFKEGPYRTLKFGHKRRHYTESIYNPKDPLEMPAVYTQVATLGVAYAKELKRAAIIGMGGGRTTWYLSHHLPAMKITGVELDPEIVKIADKYFDVRAGGNLDIATRDGRIYMRRSKEQYDYIAVDAYRGPFVPFHLLTQEFYELLEKRLKPGGVVVQNIEPSTMLFDHALATINSVFDNVDLYKARGNIIAIAHNGPRLSDEDLKARAELLQGQYGFAYSLPAMAESRVPTPDWEQDKVLTDDFAPANYLKSVAAHNRKWETE